MYVNNCQRRNAGDCTANFLGRFAFQPLKENPLLGPSSATLLKMGALNVSKVVHGRQGWRLITCIWHSGFMLELFIYSSMCYALYILVFYLNKNLGLAMDNFYTHCHRGQSRDKRHLLWRCGG